MRRRDFITLLGSAATAWTPAVRAQPVAIPVVGFLSSGMPGAIPRLVAAFRQGLGEGGYVEGQNVTIDFRWAEGQYNRLPELADDMVRRQVNVIAAWGPVAALAAKAASSKTPIVFAAGGDVVKSGLVTSVNRPGGNATGVNLFTQAVEAKKFELLIKLAPATTTVAFLINPDNPAVEGKTQEMREAARALGRQLHILNASTESEINMAFATLVQQQLGALVINADPFFDDIQQRQQFVALAARHRVPVIYGQRAYAVEGGLVSYGTSIAEAYRQVGIYTWRILKGEKPADLPVVQPTKFELVINLKTAKALNLDLPPTLLALADEVIE